jgi:hypothetical protein
MAENNAVVGIYNFDTEAEIPHRWLRIAAETCGSKGPNSH